MSLNVHLERLSPLPEDHDCEAAAERLKQAVAAAGVGDVRARVVQHDGDIRVEFDAPWGHGYVAADGGVFRIDEMAPPAATMLHAVASACDLVMLPDAASAGILLVRREQLADLEGFRPAAPPVVCPDATALDAQLRERMV